MRTFQLVMLGFGLAVAVSGFGHGNAMSGIAGAICAVCFGAGLLAGRRTRKEV